MIDENGKDENESLNKAQSLVDGTVFHVVFDAGKMPVPRRCETVIRGKGSGRDSIAGK